MKHLRKLFLALLALALPAGAWAQDPAAITGRVTNEAGQPLPSVNVQVEAMGIGTITQADGRYQMIVPAGRIQAGQAVVVVANMIGYRARTAEVTLSPGATVEQNFVLSIDPLRIEEIVVTGAGLQTRAERMGTARATVDNQMIRRSAEPNVITALASKSPNVITTQTSGDPGAGTAIRIRGVTGFGVGGPAIIVDGMPINNTARTTGPSVLQGGPATNRAFDINPEDIESIEILKGPAATSIFGASAGAGGAILITTRRGAAGETRFSLRSTAQFDRPTNYVPLQRRFGSGTAGAATTCLVSPTPACTHNNPTWGPELPSGTPTFDHARELFETGAMFDNTLSISGGSEQTRFFLSAGVMNHNGFLVSDNDQFKRYTVRLNADHQARSNLRVGGNIAYAQTDGRFVGRGNTVNGLLLGALRTPPEFNNRDYLDENGLHRSYRFPMPRPQDLINANRGFDNPFFAIHEHPNTGEVGRVYGNVNWNWTPLPWLTVNHTLGADYASDDRTEAFHPSASGAAAGGQLNRWQFYDRMLDHNILATASFMLREGISGSVSAGQNLNERYFRQISVSAQEFIAPFPYKLANTVNRSPPTDAESKRRLEGYFGQAELDVNDQFFVTARLRNDGASTFGLDNQRAWYPGGQVAWTFTRAFNPLPENILGLGKLRLAYGQSGQEPGVYQLQDIMNTGAISDFNPGSSIVPTLAGFGGLWTGGARGNPSIKPERVAELDMGIDLVVFNGRADFALTHYRQDSEDVIFSVAVPPSTGAGSVTLNAGELQNRGWETVLNVRPIQTPTVSLNIGANWARNRNLVTGLGNIGVDADGNIVPRDVTGYSTSFVGSTTHAQVGEPLGIFRGFGYARCGITPNVFTTGGTTYDMTADCAGAPTGALYLTASGLPINDPNERIIGDPNPDWTAGLNAELSIRGVRVSAFVDHRQGGSTFNMTRGSLQSLGVHGFTDIRDQTGRFEQLYPFGHNGVVVGPGAGVPVQIGQSFFGNFGGLGTREHLMEDATHTRLREVSLAYTFTQPWVSRIAGMSSIDVRVAGRNLHTWTDYSGFDPEVHTGGAAVANRGIDWFQNPLSRAWVLSVGLNR